MYEDDNEHMEAAEQLARLDPRAGAEVISVQHASLDT
jgi:hypothetical protein